MLNWWNRKRWTGFRVGDCGRAQTCVLGVAVACREHRCVLPLFTGTRDCLWDMQDTLRCFGRVESVWMRNIHLVNLAGTLATSLLCGCSFSHVLRAGAAAIALPYHVRHVSISSLDCEVAFHTQILGLFAVIYAISLRRLTALHPLAYSFTREQYIAILKNKLVPRGLQWETHRSSPGYDSHYYMGTLLHLSLMSSRLTLPFGQQASGGSMLN